MYDDNFIVEEKPAVVIKKDSDEYVYSYLKVDQR
jgi:hypothetical protein